MKTLDQIFDIIENNEISIIKYTEENKLCGYELNTYTMGGVNQIIFLDFRDNGNPEKYNDFIEKFSKRVKSIDIDDEIELNRQDQNYKDNFSLRESLNDFEEWKDTLGEIVKKIQLIEKLKNYNENTFINTDTGLLYDKKTLKIVGATP